MPKQLALRFDEVPVTDKTQARYHAIDPCLAGRVSASRQAEVLNLSYRTIHRWLQQFREEGMLGLFPASQFPRGPARAVTRTEAVVESMTVEIFFIRFVLRRGRRRGTNCKACRIGPMIATIIGSCV